MWHPFASTQAFQREPKDERQCRWERLKSNELRPCVYENDGSAKVYWNDSIKITRAVRHIKCVETMQRKKAKICMQGIEYMFDFEGKDTHVSVASNAISAFMESDKSSMICFRCGQTGHVRYQCLSYKVRLCWHYINATCNDPLCSFAHGDSELRTPWKQRCVRVVKQGGELVCIGCNSTEHTFRRCPLHQDLLLL